jgi:hypothetical protein
MLYTVKELAERCGVDEQFVEDLRTEGGRFHPCAWVERLMEPKIELYDSLDALMLLWVKVFIERGETWHDARRAAEDIVEGYYDDAEKGLA